MDVNDILAANDSDGDDIDIDGVNLEDILAGNDDFDDTSPRGYNIYIDTLDICIISIYYI